VIGKNVKGTEKVFKKDESDSFNFSKRVVTTTFYAMKWKQQAYFTRDELLVVSKSYLDYFG